MSEYQVFETPREKPNDDLLGMKDYAEQLATFLDGVSPPFTLGVYGEWGDGKTTFVNFLRHYLESRHGRDVIRFIGFSAWPHSTADTLWRALIIAIARALYGFSPDDDPKPAPPPERGWTGWWPLVADFLRNDALVLRKPPAVLDARAEYEALVAQLDRTAYGSISRSADQNLQVNQEVAMMTIVNGAIAALGAVSPLVAQVRSLFSDAPKPDMTKLVQAEKNSATRSIIESVSDFKKMFSRLFSEKAQGKRVFVFVDDLDRCLPDVALDVLEAIKIFLDEIGCIFIVAADKDLISQGLRLRYRSLHDSGDPAQVRSFYDQKGQEYFEKIIQFGIRVPPRSFAQGHAFIAAQFPQWISATDIIQCAIGSNPRRLKQYCNLLSYQHSVARMQARARAAKTAGSSTSA